MEQKRDTRACMRKVSWNRKVEVIVYRLYAVDEKEAHLIQNEGFQENEMFYIQEKILSGVAGIVKMTQVVVFVGKQGG